MKADHSGSDTVVGDECHIVSPTRNGPRGDEPYEGNMDGYDNLVLLCKTHHKLADDNPEDYTAERLRQLKRKHEVWVHSTLEPKPHSRAGVRPQEFLSRAAEEFRRVCRDITATPTLRGNEAWNEIMEGALDLSLDEILEFGQSSTWRERWGALLALAVHLQNKPELAEDQRIRQFLGARLKDHNAAVRARAVRTIRRGSVRVAESYRSRVSELIADEADPKVRGEYQNLLAER